MADSSIKQWADDVLTIKRGFKWLYRDDPAVSDQDISDLIALCASPYFYWRKEKQTQEQMAVEAEEMRRVFGTPQGAKGASPPQPPAQVCSECDVANGDHLTGCPVTDAILSAAMTPGESGAVNETTASIPVARPDAAPPPKPAVNLGLQADRRPALKPPTQSAGKRIPALVGKTWDRLHFSPYASVNMAKALERVFKDFDDKSFLMPNALTQDVPQIAPEEYRAIVDALPQKEWEALLTITGALNSRDKKPYSGRRRY